MKGWVQRRCSPIILLLPLVRKEGEVEVGGNVWEGRRRVMESLWIQPNPGPGACTDSTNKKDFQLQYRQKVQGQANSQGGDGVREEGRGGEEGPVWGALARDGRYKVLDRSIRYR